MGWGGEEGVFEVMGWFSLHLLFFSVELAWKHADAYGLVGIVI